MQELNLPQVGFCPYCSLRHRQTMAALSHYQSNCFPRTLLIPLAKDPPIIFAVSPLKNKLSVFRKSPLSSLHGSVCFPAAH